MKRTLQCLFVALGLLLAQQAAWVHELSHLDRGTADAGKKHTSPTKACVECGLLAQLGSSFPSNLSMPGLAAACERSTLQAPWVFYARIPRRFLSRAPPVPR